MKLIDWQLQRLTGIHAGRREYGRGRDDVTVLIYFFWNESVAEAAFPAFECALRETWLRCGMMKTVIVTNANHRCVADFASGFPQVEIQVVQNLTPGVISSMSLDCVTKLHTRFATSYVLIVQNDGFPLREGLDDFVGKYDFIGAPATRDQRRGLLRALGFPCLNGGFSLRSKRMCEKGCRAWQALWRHLIKIDSRFFSEDTFYTFTAMLSPFYRCGLKFPSEAESFSFSYESLNDMISLPAGVRPFGFHGQPTAVKLLDEGGFFD